MIGAKATFGETAHVRGATGRPGQLDRRKKWHPATLCVSVEGYRASAFGSDCLESPVPASSAKIGS